MSKTWKIIIGAVIAIVAVAVLGSLASGKPDPKLAALPEATSSQTTAPAAKNAAQPAPKKLTKGQEEAAAKAETYVSFTGFSRKGLIHQLTAYDKFSVSDATVGVDSLNINWNEQAAKKAQTYLEMANMSQRALVSQLTSGAEGFTKAQAEYGAKVAYEAAG